MWKLWESYSAFIIRILVSGISQYCFYIQNLPVKRGDTFLERGCGMRIISVATALKAETFVTAIDITPYPAFNAIADPNFPVIGTNTKKKNLFYLEQAIYDPGYQILTRYLKEAPLCISVDGRLFVGDKPMYENFVKLKELPEEKDDALKSILGDQPYPQIMFEFIEGIFLNKERVC